MSYLSAARREAERQRRMHGAVDVYTPTPTIGEAFSASHRIFDLADKPTAPLERDRMFFAPQREELLNMQSQGLISDEEMEAHIRRPGRGRTQIDWEALGKYVNERDRTDRFDFSIDSANAAVAEEVRDLENTLDYGNALTTTAAFVGGMAGYATDPFSLAVDAAIGIPTGGLAPLGKTAFSSAAKAAWRGYALGSASAAVQQAFAAQYRNEIGLEYGLGAAAATILLGGLMEGALGGGVAFGRHIYSQGVNSDFTASLNALHERLESQNAMDSPDPFLREAYFDTEVMRAVARQFPDTAPARQVRKAAEDAVAHTRALRDSIDHPPLRVGMEEHFAPADAVQTPTAPSPAAEPAGAPPRPSVDDAMVRGAELDRIVAELTEAVEATRLHRGERNAIQQDLAQARRDLKAVDTVELAPPVKGKKEPARAFKQRATEAQDKQREELRAPIRQRIAELEVRTEQYKEGLRQKGDLVRIQQGVIPEQYRYRLEEAVAKAKADAAEPGVAASPDTRPESSTLAETTAPKVTGVEDDFKPSVPEDTVVTLIDENGDEVVVSFKQAIEAIDAEHAEIYQSMDRALSCFYGQ
jgi:hypothetical protein